MQRLGGGRRQNRVQEFNSKGEYITKFGSEGTGNGQFKSPSGSAIDFWESSIWVVDAGNSRVQRIGLSGTYRSKFGTKGTGNSQLKEPQGDRHRLQRQPLGRRHRQQPDRGVQLQRRIHRQIRFCRNRQRPVQRPGGLAIDSEGNIWVADTLNARIQELNAKGEYIRQFGSKGAANGHFDRPSALNSDPEGNVWVADTNNNRIQEFNSKGEYLSQFGSPGSGAGQLSEPTNVGVDSGGDIWVTDTSGNRIQKWTPNRPIVSAEATGKVTPESATLHGLVNPNGLSTTYRFE